ncbi:MAG: hypothetical protein R3E12_09215 [Candidatus Eisenbacteria bacterium]
MRLAVAEYLNGDSLWVASHEAAVHFLPEARSSVTRTLDRGALVIAENLDGEWWKVRYLADMSFDRHLDTTTPVFEDGFLPSIALCDSATTPLAQDELAGPRSTGRMTRDDALNAERARDAQERADARHRQLLAKWGEPTASRIMNNQIWLGMTTDMAHEALGSPTDVNASVGSWGRHEQWVYDRFDLYLYFENGILTSWQE